MRGDRVSAPKLKVKVEFIYPPSLSYTLNEKAKTIISKAFSCDSPLPEHLCQFDENAKTAHFYQ